MIQSFVLPFYCTFFVRSREAAYREMTSSGILAAPGTNLAYNIMMNPTGTFIMLVSDCEAKDNRIATSIRAGGRPCSHEGVWPIVNRC